MVTIVSGRVATKKNAVIEITVMVIDEKRLSLEADEPEPIFLILREAISVMLKTSSKQNGTYEYITEWT